MKNIILTIVRCFYNRLDYSHLGRIIDSLRIHDDFNFMFYDLIEDRFNYFVLGNSKIFDNIPDEKPSKGYQFLKKTFHPLDFANLIKEIVTLIRFAENTNKKLVKTKNSGQILRAKSKIGKWQTARTNLIYINGWPEQKFKVLIAFIEEDTANNRIKITPRENEIFKLLSSGYSAKMIASKLNISETTVITHRKNLIHKLKAKNSAELVRKGYELNLIN